MAVGCGCYQSTTMIFGVSLVEEEKKTEPLDQKTSTRSAPVAVCFAAGHL
jgi:hypothetical protein